LSVLSDRQTQKQKQTEKKCFSPRELAPKNKKHKKDYGDYVIKYLTEVR